MRVEYVVWVWRTDKRGIRERISWTAFATEKVAEGEAKMLHERHGWDTEVEPLRYYH